MIRSDVGVTACFTLVAVTVNGCDPSRRVFTTLLNCVFADSGVFTLFVITCPLKASSQAPVNLIPRYHLADRRVAVFLGSYHPKQSEAEERQFDYMTKANIPLCMSGHFWARSIVRARTENPSRQTSTVTGASTVG